VRGESVHSPPIRALFSTTERFIKKTTSVTASIVVAGNGSGITAHPALTHPKVSTTPSSNRFIFLIDPFIPRVNESQKEKFSKKQGHVVFAFRSYRG
jgi:hypothetical protein